MDVTLGRFGDARLEKGGPFCMPDLSPIAARVLASDGSAMVVPERCG